MANYTSTHTGATIDASVTIVSSSGVTQSDLTKLNAVTSSAVELNLLDGVTASTAEINILDGLTATTAELNYLDGADSSITTLSLPDNTTITTFGASLIDDADAASARTTLGVDAAGTDNSTDVTLVTTSHDYLSISGQAITLGSIDISDDTNLVGGTGITLTGDTLSTTDSEIVHDNLSGFVANEHIDHSTVSISAGTGLSGGGDLTSTRTLSIDSSVVTLSGTQTLANKSISGTANTISNVHIVDDTINTLTIARGGTGGTTASEARSNLNVDVAGTDNSTDVTLVTTSHDYLSLTGQAITLGTIDISDDTNLVGGTGITFTGDTLSTTDSEIVHDNLSGFVSNEHIDHSTVSITAGTGLSGGGDITTSRTLTTDDSAIVHDNLSGFVANEHIDHSGVSITAGAGLTGGGDITATRDIAVGAGTGVTVNADDIAIGQDVATTADVTFNSVTSDDFIGSLNGAVQFQAKATVALNKGDAVYVVGISGNTPTIALADANDATKMPSFGLAASSASIDDFIEVVTFGTLTNINTSAFSQGDVLFISSNGTSGNTLTATKEAGESVLCQNIGKVIRSHATVGSIKVGGAGRANATPNLNDGNIFIGNGSNQPVTASLNTKIEDYLDGGTSTANFDTISVDGAEITATPAELNVLDGITSTTAELNYTDGVTSNIQTQLDAKAPLASPAFTGTATGVNLTLSGDLTVNGSTTTLDTTNLAVEDNLMELNAGVTSNANDSGFLIERGTTGDNAIFMWDESADKFTLGTTTATGTTTGDITLSSTGTLVANVEGNVTGAVTGNADTATTLATARNFSLTGDVTAGAVSFDGSGNVALSTTIAANSVALGTDTTGNYMSDLTEGTGIDITHTPAEGSNATITLDLTEVGFGGGANRLITDDGDGTVSTEANLTFDGSTLALTGDLNVGSGDFFVDDSTGNVGIGVTSPLATLDLGNATGERMYVYSNGSAVRAGFGVDLSGSSRELSIFHSSSNASDGNISFGHRLESNGSYAERMRITGAGNVGIGASSNINERLNVYHSSSADVLGVVGVGSAASTNFANINFRNLYSSATGDSAIIGCDTGSTTDKGELVFSTSGGSMNATEKMRIDEDGNVGIGTASPSAKLDVRGNVSFFSPDASDFVSFTHSDNGIIINSAGSTSNKMFLRTGGSDALTIDASQNVGIGTASPLSKLHIEESTNDADALMIRQTAGGSGSVQGKVHIGMNHFNSTNPSVRITAEELDVSDYRGNLAFSTRAGTSDVAPTEKMRITHDGLVGIGDDNPPNKLSVKGSSTDLLYLEGDGITSTSIIASDTGGSVRTRSAGGTWQVYTGGSAGSNSASGATFAMEVDSSQNVGIGTTSPGYKLDVSGNARFTSDLRNEGRLLNSVGTSASPSYSFYSQGNAGMYRSGDGVGFSAAGSSVFDINSTRMYINTNVGIGTSSPTQDLHLHRTGVGDDVYIQFTNGDTGSTSGDGLQIGLAGNEDARIIQKENSPLEFWTNNTLRASFEADGDFVPNGDGVYDLGASANRWAVVYSADLDLSNEGSQNDVDGTWGSYVIQEGEEDLFLINRRNGKKYKFMLQEVQD